jgi:hypothetical protein
MTDTSTTTPTDEKTRQAAKVELNLTPVDSLPKVERNRTSASSKRVEQLVSFAEQIRTNSKAAGKLFSAGTYNILSAAQNDAQALRKQYGTYPEDNGWTFTVRKVSADGQPDQFGFFMKYDPSQVDAAKAKARHEAAQARVAKMQAGRKTARESATTPGAGARTDEVKTGAK